MAFVFAGLTVYVNATSFVAQDVLGLSPWGFWLIFTAYGLSVFAGGWANAPLSARYGPRRMLAVDLAVAITTTAALVVITWVGTLSVAVYAVLIVVCCAAVAGVMANATTLTLGRVSFAAGSGAALMGCVQFALGRSGRAYRWARRTPDSAADDARDARMLHPQPRGEPLRPLARTPEPTRLSD